MWIGSHDADLDGHSSRDDGLSASMPDLCDVIRSEWPLAASAFQTSVYLDFRYCILRSRAAFVQERASK